MEAYTGTGPDPVVLDNNVSESLKNMTLGKTVSLSDGTTYYYRLRACDDWGCSNYTSSDQFHMNEEPSINSAGPDPSSPTVNNVVNITANVTDDDGDSITWVNFTVWNQSSDEIVINNSNGTQNGAIWVSNNFIVSIATTVYNWTVVASDSYENSTTSGSFTVGNDVPSIVSGPTFTDYSSEHAFNVSAVGDDANGGSDFVSCTIYMDDGDGNSYTEAGTLNTSYGTGTQAACNFSKVNTSYPGFVVSESIDVWVMFNDTAGDTAQTPTVPHVIPNKNPGVSNVNITPASPETDQNLISSYTYSDPENDPLSTVFYTWYKNNQSTGITTANVSSSNTIESEEWKVGIFVQDQYGALSTTENSSQVTIQNSLPSIVNQIYFMNSSTEHSFYVNATAFDKNNESDVTSCMIYYSAGANFGNKSGNLTTAYGNGSEVKCNSTISTNDETWIQPKTNVNVTIGFSDESGEVNTTQASSAIPNRIPAIDLTSPQDNSNFTSPQVTLNWSSTDIDGDNLTFNVAVDNNSDFSSPEFSNITNLTSKAPTLNDGVYYWKVSVNDSYDVNSSEVRTFTIDTRSPQFILVNITPLAPKENESVTCYSKWTDNFNLTTAIIYENATNQNHTISNFSTNESWANWTINAANLPAGSIKCEFFASDHLSNSNSTSLVFDVKDITPPDITDVAYSPPDLNSLDPGVTVNITATITDNLGLDTILLQYKNSSEPAWNSLVMNNTQGDTYKGNFTPNEDNYTYRVWANDTAGNVNWTSNTTLEIFRDWTWTMNPSAFGTINGFVSENITIGNLTINNIGDYPLGFEITSSSAYTSPVLNVSYNDSTYFNLNSGEVKVIQVTVSSASDGENTVTFTINATNTSSNPSSLTSDAEVRIATSGPYLSPSVEAPLSVKQGERGVQLMGSIENIGNETAADSWIAFELPDGWVPASGSLNASVGDVNAGATNISVVSVNISSSASVGTKTVVVRSSCSGCSKVHEKSVNVDVVEVTTITIAVHGGRGDDIVKRRKEMALPTYSPTPSDRAQLFQSVKFFELVRGSSDSFSIRVTNPFPNSTLENVTLSVKGYFSQHMKITPSMIPSIGYGETGEFEVFVIAPSYLGSTYYLNSTITGKVLYLDYPSSISEDTGEVLAYKNVTLDMVEGRTIALMIHGISREDAMGLLAQAEKDITVMQKAGCSVNRVSKFRGGAKMAFEDRDYDRVKELVEKIASAREASFTTHDLIKDLKDKIQDAENRGLKVIETKKLFNLVLAAFEREDYTTAQERINDALLLYSLETKGKVNYTKLILDNWQTLLAGIVLASIAGVMAYRRLIVRIIARKLKGLDVEEVNIAELMEEAQKKCYVEKSMSTAAYHKTMRGYENRLAKIKQTRANLRAKRVGIINISGEMENLKNEDLSLTKMMKDAQDGYFNKRSLGRGKYQKLMERYTSRKAEVEGSMAMLEAKLAKKKRLEETRPKWWLNGRLKEGWIKK